MKNHDLLRELFKKRMDGTLSPEEEEELEELIDDSSDEELSEALEEVFTEVDEVDASYYEHDWEAVRQKIVALPITSGGSIHSPAEQSPAAKKGTSFYRLPAFRYAAAAILLIAAGLTCWLLLNRPSDNRMASGPCGLRLPSSKDDVIRIDMIHDKITFSVPRSWQYALTLPDGSKVWLNAASSITYPRSFTGDSREVSIEGEAYFDIDSSSTKPFYVTTKGKRMPAPGEHFNINAWEEVIVSIDTLQSNSWREGYFAFKKAGVKSVVEELARWYDWKVEYRSDIKPKTVTVSFCRNTSEDDALQELRSRGIDYQKRGNKITIL